MPNRYPTRYILAITAVLLMSACGSAETDAATETSTAAASTTVTAAAPATTLPSRPPADYAGFVAQPTACGAEAPDLVAPLSFAVPEDQGLDAAQVVSATITTSCGDIAIELDPAMAPATVNSFVFLASAGYFDGSVSHRVVPGFVIQAGDQTATGREGPGYTIPDELPEPGFVYEQGTLAMANSGPNSTGSQFFIVLADARLNPDFSAFGRVVDGFETLDRIAALPLGPNAFGELSVPLETVFIESVTITG